MKSTCHAGCYLRVPPSAMGEELNGSAACRSLCVLFQHLFIVSTISQPLLLHKVTHVCVLLLLAELYKFL